MDTSPPTSRSENDCCGISGNHSNALQHPPDGHKSRAVDCSALYARCSGDNLPCRSYRPSISIDSGHPKANAGQCRVDLALNPKTYPDTLHYFVDDIETVLIMTTDELKVDNHFITAMYEKIQQCNRLRIQRVVVDCDVHEENLSRERKCGATYVVEGRVLFRNREIERNHTNLIKALPSPLKEASH